LSRNTEDLKAMPTKRKTKPAAKHRQLDIDGSLGTLIATSGGPSTLAATPEDAQFVSATLLHALAVQKFGTGDTVSRVPYNENKQYEYGSANALTPVAGTVVASTEEIVSASTTSEIESNTKIGEGIPTIGASPGSASLDRARSDAGGQVLTTNMGLSIGDNQSSLKAGLRGPTLLEDFILREKLTHFDHERIPERIVHARGSGAHGYFECFEPLNDVTMAAPFAAAGKRTPVFARFSTVAGERGSADAVRDVRGFAVKFYTEAGNWDIVGNNMPVFFIQDAMKFPDLVHAVKPEPHHGMPQAASAHDTFWDFVSLMPESTHMLLWTMSDRAIPRSYSTMQGFGVHTFRLVNEMGESVFCKFHWNPKAGTHSLVWDEAVKINGADPDFHRRDLWESIESGNFPEWELGVQVFTEEQAESFDFDVLDATKLIPEEMVPVLPIGRMVLNRNPDNFFAETEQIAFGTANVVPGIDFSNDPLLAGRHHSYLDTQLSRLGGPNFHEIPINSPIAKVHNNQRDGMHRQAIPRGRVAYEPNSLGGGCPFQAGLYGYASFPAATHEDKLRGKPEKFAEHFSQATLFWNSQSETERLHIVAAFRFELSKVQTQPIRERVVSMLANVAAELAEQVADGLGFPVPPAMPRLVEPKQAELEQSAALSLTARPGDGSLAGLRVAVIVGEGSDVAVARKVYGELIHRNAAPRILAARLGSIGGAGENDASIHVEVSYEIAPSALWDACVLIGTLRRNAGMTKDAALLDFLSEQYRHCKPIVVVGDCDFLDAANVSFHLPPESSALGVAIMKTLDVDALCEVLVARRYFDREQAQADSRRRHGSEQQANAHPTTVSNSHPTLGQSK
jgi:catalase